MTVWGISEQFDSCVQVCFLFTMKLINCTTMFAAYAVFQCKHVPYKTGAQFIQLQCSRGNKIISEWLSKLIQFMNT